MNPLYADTCYVDLDTGQATLVTNDYYAFSDCANFNDYVGDYEIPIYTWNKRYSSPYVAPADSPEEFLRDLIGKKAFGKLAWKDAGDDFNIIKRSALEAGYYIAPISLLDHSMLQYKIGISHGWDYSYCGFACVAKAEFDTWLGCDTTIEDFKQNLEHELEYLNAYANGAGYLVEIYDLETQELIEWQNNLAFVEDLAPSVSDPEKAIFLEDCSDIEEVVEELQERGILPETYLPKPTLDTYEQLKSDYPEVIEALRGMDDSTRERFINLVDTLIKAERNLDSLEAQVNKLDKLEQKVQRASCSLNSLAQEAKIASETLSKNDIPSMHKEREL